MKCALHLNLLLQRFLLVLKHSRILLQLLSVLILKILFAQVLSLLLNVVNIICLLSICPYYFPILIKPIFFMLTTLSLYEQVILIERVLLLLVLITHRHYRSPTTSCMSMIESLRRLVISVALHTFCFGRFLHI